MSSRVSRSAGDWGALRLRSQGEIGGTLFSWRREDPKESYRYVAGNDIEGTIPRSIEFEPAGALFTTSGAVLMASSDTTGGSTTLTATSSTYASCSANLEHLGAPAGGDVRFFVFDDRTGQPVVGADVVIDSSTNSALTGDDGIATITMSPSVPFNVTVFVPSDEEPAMVTSNLS